MDGEKHDQEAKEQNDGRQADGLPGFQKCDLKAFLQGMPFAAGQFEFGQEVNGVVHSNTEDHCEDDRYTGLQFYADKTEEGAGDQQRQEIRDQGNDQHPNVAEEQNHDQAHDQDRDSQAHDQAPADILRIFINDEARTGLLEPDDRSIGLRIDEVVNFVAQVF